MKTVNHQVRKVHQGNKKEKNTLCSFVSFESFVVPGLF
jgi:hypothetical protein